MDDDSENNSLASRVSEGFKEGARPGFLGGDGGGDAPGGSKAEKRAEKKAAAEGAAINDLKNAESNASRNSSYRGDGLDAARKNEEEGGGGLYSGGDKASKMASAAKDIKKGNFRGAFKKVGPAVGILLVIFIVGGTMAGMQLFQPFSLIAQFQESFNSMHVSANERTARFYRAQMDSGRYKDPLRGNSIFGKKFKMSDKQRTELARQGIEVDDDFEGTGERVMKYKDGDVERIIVPDERAKARLNAAGIGDGRAVDTFEKAYVNNRHFAHAYNSGSMTWRGQFASWFGTKTNDFLKRNKITRNLFKEWKKAKAEAEASGKKPIDLVKQLIGKRTETINDGGTRRLMNGEDENGNNIQSADQTSSERINRSNLDADAAAAKIQKIADNISGKSKGGAASTVANAGCAVVDFIGAVNLLVTGAEALQIINLISSYMEAVDKTKAGYGDEAPINELADTLNEPTENSSTVIEPTASGEGITIEGRSVNLGTREIKTVKTAMQSEGIAALYGNGYADPNDPNLQTFNLSKSMGRILNGIGVSMTSFQTCLIARSGAALVDAGIAIGQAASCLATFWAAGGACWSYAFNVGLGIGAGILLSTFISGVAGLIIPWAVNALTRDLVSQLGGEELGNALVSGANMYQGNVHKANGGSLATVEKYESFAVAQQKITAEVAREERASLSPFDVTSKNTFMGVIFGQLMNFNNSNSIMGAVTSANTVVNSSLIGLAPSASAIATKIAETLPDISTYESTCPYLASIWAIGDSFCNPYLVTDMGTMDMDPDDIINEVNSLGGFSSIKEDGNVTIDKNSELAKYAIYCGERVSPFGVADQDIANSVISGSLSTGNAMGDTVVGSIPVLGDGVEILQDVNKYNNLGYISGESCVAGNSINSNVFTESPSWNEAKYYQRFIEDQSLAESMGIIEKSAVTVLLEEYYKENPLDNSYEGQLARYSGLDKEMVSDIIDVIAYYNYVGNYDPSERYAFGAPALDIDDSLSFEQENVMGDEAIVLEGIVYADVRNRTFVI